jgi:prepilin-type N-terminal cleavage/methylation domain-containing protein
MIQHPINRFKKSCAGVTLIECLVVLTILAALSAAVGTSFVMTLKSYVGEFEAEALELESQRAALELEYYAARATDIKILSWDHPSTSARSFSPVLGGTRVELTQPDGSIITFQYTPRPESPKGFTAGVYETGFLGVNIQGNTYTYGSQVKFLPVSGWRYPFQVSNEGGLAYRWEIPTPASGNIKMGGAVLPGI